MPDIESTVQSHYGGRPLLARMEAALAANGIDPLRPKPEDLWPYDQLHGRGIIATREHAERAGIKAGMHVLDLGCGVGGASRYLAALGCRVTGIDLTPEFIDVARTLTERCHLADRIDYRVGNALDLPFADASFDHVWSHNVTMNIQDKAGFVGEAARVLKPGGHFSLAEVEAGPSGQPAFPVPWASDSSSSFLVSPDEMRTVIEGAGLRIVAQEDGTAAVIAYGREMSARIERGERPLQTVGVLMGDDFPQRARNMAEALREGKAVVQFMMAAKV
ncbi:MAG TPA: methyltransferase domain-containing protein [Pseudolabrys sp.]|nr:methyltransferase domain-containing protein [Pseudolabrys sp.]